MQKIQHSENPNQLLNETQTADLLQIGVRTLQKWRIAGEGPKWKKIGAKMVRYQIGDLMSWTDSQTVSSTSEAAAQ